MNSIFKQAFPELETEGYQETSPASEKYNCIAWAAGEQAEWWWPYQDPRYCWPEGLPRVVTLDGFIQAFVSIGYEQCENGDLEMGVEKVAIYALDSQPKHAARQLADGKWTSKLGKDIDIAHTLCGLEGPVYGKVVAFLKRRKPGTQ